MYTLQTFWLWLVKSSADPQRYSLFLKGLGGTVLTFLLLGAGIFHYQLDATQVTDFFSFLSLAVTDAFTAISYIATAVSAWAVVWGALRKLFTTVTGTNAVLARR